MALVYLCVGVCCFDTCIDLLWYWLYCCLLWILLFCGDWLVFVVDLLDLVVVWVYLLDYFVSEFCILALTLCLVVVCLFIVLTVVCFAAGLCLANLVIWLAWLGWLLCVRFALPVRCFSCFGLLNLVLWCCCGDCDLCCCDVDSVGSVVCI